MKKKIPLLILMLLLVIPLMAQPNNPTNPVPIDGGLGLLAAGGLLYAVSGLKKRGKPGQEGNNKGTKEE